MASTGPSPAPSRPSPRPSPAPANSSSQLNTHVQRWESRLQEHAKNAADLPATLGAPEKRQPPAVEPSLDDDAAAEEPTKRQKLIVRRKADDETTRFCIAIANQHISEAQDTVGKLPAKSFLTDDAPIEPALQVVRINFHSNSRPMSELDRQLAAAKRADRPSIQLIDAVPEVGPKPPTTIELGSAQQSGHNGGSAVAAPVPLKAHISGKAFEGADLRSKLDNLYSPKMRYFNKKAKDTEAGIEAVEKPVDSRSHIQKLLWLCAGTPSLPFQPCVNAKQGICHAQTTVPHPLAPQRPPMMAYLSVADYALVLHGTTAPCNVSCGDESTAKLGYQNYCEFCYRIFIQMQVEQSKQHNHRTSAELCDRYYQVGPGEYSDDGMYQAVEKKGVRFSHGIFGKMRIFKRNDFLPVMGRLGAVLDSRRSAVVEILHMDAYKRLEREGRLPPDSEWIPGWEEAGPFYQANENAFYEVKQSDPYTRVFTSSARECSVASLLEDYFALRARENRPNYAHLFRDLWECLADADYVQRPFYASKSGPPWKYFCMHAYDQPAPDPVSHRLYYVLLVKINTLRKFVLGKRPPFPITKQILQKVRVYLSSYQPLLLWIRDNAAFSDAELLAPRWHNHRLGVSVSALLAFYPHPVHHYRSSDAESARLAVTLRHRDDPLTVCSLHYADVLQRHATGGAENLLFPVRWQPTEPARYQEMVEREGSDAAIAALDNHIARQLKLFQELTHTIQRYGVTFAWQDPALKKQHRQLLKALSKTEAEAEAAAAKPRKSKSAQQPHPTVVVWQKKKAPVQSFAEKKATRHKKAVLRALVRASEIVNQNFTHVAEWAAQQNRTYAALLERFAVGVFCEFSETHAWLQTLDATEIAELVVRCSCFVSVFPQEEQKVVITESTVNGVSWQQHLLLLACCVRVFVLEELHEMEPITQRTLRYNLRLLCFSHLRLVRKITEPLVGGAAVPLLRDAQLTSKSLPTQLRHAVVRGRSLLDQYYPHAAREVHQGCLPDYANSLMCVNFFTDCGMDDFPWNKIQYKKPDRCCDVREFSEMLRAFCKDPTFFAATMLELELSLKGLYEHATVSPSFARALALDELFENAQHADMKPLLIQFILNNEALVAKATSESLCYQLEQLPGLLHTLKALYKDWFAWRVFANMDMVRQCLRVDGHFQRVEAVVFKRIRLQSKRTIFRLNEVDFTVWLCDTFKKADEYRYKNGLPELPQTARLSVAESVTLQCFIYAFAPDDVIDARDLYIIGLETATLVTLNELNQHFLGQLEDSAAPSEACPVPGSAGRTAPASRRVSNKLKLIQLVHSIAPKQYVLAHQFFTLLRNYQSVRVIRLNNSTLLSQQLARLWEKPAIVQLGYIPENALRCAFSICCRNVKNSWTTRIDTASTGYEDIAFSMSDGVYTCAKRRHRNTTSKDDDFEDDESSSDEDEEEEEEESVEALLPPGDGTLQERIERRTAELADIVFSSAAAQQEAYKKLNKLKKLEAKRKRKLDRELRKPSCTATEIFTVSLAGTAIEMDTCKIPGAKKTRAVELKSAVKEHPTAGYWLTPCCGIPYSYKDSNWFPGGYACGTCSEANELARSFDVRRCSCCRVPCPVYTVHRVYDDLYLRGFRHIIICAACRTNLRKLPPEIYCFSTLLNCIANEEFISRIS